MKKMLKTYRKNNPPGVFSNARNARFDVLSILSSRAFSCALRCFLAWMLGTSSSFPLGVRESAHLASAA